MESTNIKGVAVWECCRVAAKVVSLVFFAVHFRDWFLHKKQCGESVFTSAAKVVMTDVQVLEQSIVLSHHCGENFVLGCVSFSPCQSIFQCVQHSSKLMRIS